MSDTTVMPRFTVEERAARFQRRYTGPWRTVEREVGPVVLTHRYRRRTRIEWVRLAVAGHDLWVHALWRGAIVPFVRPILDRLVRLMGSEPRADGDA